MCNLYSITTNQAAIIALFRFCGAEIGDDCEQHVYARHMEAA